MTKPKPGRPSLGRDARTVVIAVKFSAREIAAIRKAVKAPGTVSSWIRDHALSDLQPLAAILRY